MIQVSNLSKNFGEQTIFDSVSFIIGKGEKVGLVGRNGSGKTTLFRLILGSELFDAGNISIPRNYTIGSLEQHIIFSETTVLNEVVACLKEEERYDHYKGERILAGLGFSREDMQKSPDLFSGGFQIRINLAKVLVQNPDMLLLDEPTNYLDITGLRWLKRFLRSFPGELILITHDRGFMDEVVTHTMGIFRRKMRKIKGMTAKLYEKIIEEEIIYEQGRVNLEKRKREIEGFVERFKAKASKATQAQSKMKMLEKMGTMDQLAVERDLHFRFNHQACPGKTVITVDNLKFSYDSSGPELINDLSFSVGRSDVVAIIGRNGKGKSTLLNLLASELNPVSGTIRKHPLVQTGHFGQMNVQRLDQENTVIDEIIGTNHQLANSFVRNICGTMMFGGELAKKKISVLSGGERARVLLGKIIANPANVLLLDEPTNHLDMESIDSLVREIIAYQGAVIIVTHSEMILRQIATKFIVFHRGKVEFFNGTYDEFLEKTGFEDEEPGLENKKLTGRLSRKDMKKRRFELIAERSRIIKPLREQILFCEEQIDKLEMVIEQNTKLVEVASQNGEGEKIGKLSKEMSLASIEIEKLFDQLEKATEKENQQIEKYDKLLNCE